MGIKKLQEMKSKLEERYYEACCKEHERINNNTTIITRELNALEFDELRDYMNMCIRQSIFDYNDQDKSWFKDCTMDEYFVEYQDIYDDDVKVGIGLDTISHKFVLNDETQADFERAFWEARDKAYEEAIQDAIDEIEDDDDDDIEVIELDDSISEKEQDLIDRRVIGRMSIISDRIDAECSKLEHQGYTRVAYDSDELLEFGNPFADDILEAGYNITTDKIAKYLGATVKVAYQGSEEFDYVNIYYKK